MELAAACCCACTALPAAYLWLKTSLLPPQNIAANLAVCSA